MGTSFGYNRMEDPADYLTVADLVRVVIDVTAHGGNLLLNVGPTGDGRVPWTQAERLLALGVPGRTFLVAALACGHARRWARTRNTGVPQCGDGRLQGVCEGVASSRRHCIAPNGARRSGAR